MPKAVRFSLSRSLFRPACVLLIVAACSGPSYDVRRDEAAGNFDSAAQKLERMRDARPRDFQTRVELAGVYYQLARKAIDDKKQDAYLQYLKKAQTELLEAIRIDPTSPQPHTQMGIIAAYQGDLDASWSSFRNALRLGERDRSQPIDPIFYSNLAHIAVYQNKLSEARRYLDRATKVGAPEDELARISVLAAWKADDMVEARDVCESAALTSKPFAETWDGAPLPKAMKTFGDFAQVCCENPTCGPYMEGACKRERQTVAKREIDRETLQAEMRLERERRQQLKDIYQKRLDVQISVDDPNAADKPEGSTPPKPAEATPTAKPPR